MMGTPVLILGDSGAGKSYSLRNFNPDDVMLLQCIPKMLPFKSAGWKLHGKLLKYAGSQTIPCRISRGSPNLISISLWIGRTIAMQR